MAPTQGRLAKYNVANRLYKGSLLGTVCIVAGISIFFFGYDQGLMGGVNTTRDYAERMGFGHWDEEQRIVVVDKPLLQGGIVAVYYLPGTLVGCLVGGWFGDRYGRIMTIGLACLWCIFTAALQSAAMNAPWMFCARVLNGFGTGVLNAITPVWATETAAHTSRGQFVAIEFTLNIFGVVVAYWLEFGTSKYYDPQSSFIWRFPVAFQIVPLIFLFIIVWLMPESPRWLVKVGREDEARFILGRLRGEQGEDGVKAEAEFQDIVNIRNLEQETAQQQSYLHMLFGIGSGKLHTGRRVQLVIWLQILQEWIGIAGITIYGPEIFSIAGISSENRLWVSGVNNITYMFATLICVFTIDRIGRRWTLYWGAIGQGICMFAAGGLARATINAGDSSSRDRIGGAATFFVFLYTAIFGATWLTVPWLYAAEIYPLQVRAKGNAWGVVGWSIGNGWTVLLLPTIFGRLHEKTLYIFGGVNILCVFVVWALYPESNQRTLEEMNLVFASDSIWTWDAERNFAKLKNENPQLVQAAKSGHGVVGPEYAISGSRKGSLALRGSQHVATEEEIASNKGDKQGTEKSSVSHI
ncbi:major facilitator superfamily protein [Hirsutella rhossiliensis]|uniref:Sugar transporter domain-containing protein n=1 Tax=Hirsutella rhossiliensis TaxID=111463 RepID=A0A9P8MN60_9HYPO|nr:sugar transporter domain-containing protein [Hirsutella rhossiliensis]KAH0958042.1 sugar transporter domain-containing protein [Hirsutella rhossiliensis]